MSEVHTPTKVFPLRCYYAKRVGRRWQVWFSHQHPSDDGEWMACSAKYWRWINAVRAANSLWAAFNDGIWIEGGRALARAAIAKAEPSERSRAALSRSAL